jgi:tetratricopeptide (TPR) repeat protein
MRAGDMFAIQDQLAGQIASRLRVELTQMQTGPARRGTESAEAYDLYEKGRFYLGQRGYTAQARANSDTATTLFAQAVRIDPAFAEARAMLGFAYAWTAVFIEENPSLIERAEAETTEAERLNAGLGQIHLTRGFVLFTWYRGWRLMDAIRENRRAVELDPGLSDNELGALLYHVGLYDEWEEADQRAIDLDPTNQQMKRTFVNEFYLVNRPEDALAMQRRLFGKDQAPDVRYFLANRRLKEAEPLIEDAMAREPNNPSTLERLALLRALQGRHAEAQALVPRILSIVQRNRNYHHVTYSIARIYALGGKAEDAARWMKETIDGGFPNYPLMASDTFLDPVRNAPEIQALLLRLRAQSEAFRAAAALPSGIY